MEPFEQGFDFEAGSIEIAEFDLFRPLLDAVRRWIWKLSHDDAELTTFQMIYEHRDGRYIHVRYLRCTLESDGGRPIWGSNAYGPEPTVYSGREAYNWMVRSRNIVPDSLLEMLIKRRAEKTSPPTALLREPDFWAKLGLKHRPPNIHYATDDRKLLGQWSLSWLEGLIRSIRELESGERNDLISSREAVRPYFLFSFPVQRGKWWGPPGSVAPKSVAVEELPWLEHEAGVKHTLVRLKSWLKPHVNCLYAEFVCAGTPEAPSVAELVRAEESLIGMLPDLEESVVHLTKALHKAASPSNQPQQRKPATRPKGTRRGERLEAIAALERAYTAHLIGAKSHAQATLERHGVAELLPFPSQEEVARQIKLTTTRASNAINDVDAGAYLRELIAIGGSVESVLSFRPRPPRRSK